MPAQFLRPISAAIFAVCLWQAFPCRAQQPAISVKHGDVSGALKETPDKKLTAQARANSIQLVDAVNKQPVGSPLTLYGPSTVACWAFSRDGKLVAAGGGTNNQGAVYVWDVATRRLRGVISVEANTSEQFGYVTALAFNADGTVVLVAAEPKIVVKRGDVSGALKQTPDKKLTVQASADSIQLVEAVKKTPVGSSLGFPIGATVACWAFSGDGKLVAAGGGWGKGKGLDRNVGLVYVWEVATGHRRATINGTGNSPFGYVTALAFNGDGAVVLVTAEGENKIVIERGDVTKALQKSPDGKLSVEFQDYGRKVFLTDVATGKPLGQPLQRRDVKFHLWAFSHDGRLVVAGGQDGQTGWQDGHICVWNVATRDLVAERFMGPEGVLGVSFSEDGQKILVRTIEIVLGDASGAITENPAKKAMANAISLKFNNSYTATCRAFSPDGKYIALGGGYKGGSKDSPDNSGAVRVWDVETGELLVDQAGYIGGKQMGRITALAFNKDGTKILLSAEKYSLSGK
jgi:WD40 repeat protein